MRKFILLTMLSLLIGLASAQMDTMDTMRVKNPYLGVAFGSPLTIQYGFGQQVIAGDDFRIHISSDFKNLVFGGDFIFDLAVLDDDGRFGLYAGGGPSVGMTFKETVYFAINLNGFIGIDYKLSDEFSLFGEGGAGFTVGAGFNDIQPRSSIGLKYHFY